MFKYLWSKFIKKIPMSCVKNTYFEKPSRVEARSTVLNSSFGRYSYAGYGCVLINCTIGRYTSIADGVAVGLANHPMNWVSTSPAFYKGRDSIPKDLASLEYDASACQTMIGNDVWIGQNVIIKAGVSIGDGAVIGMGSVVTKDVPPYAIVAGNPAHIIRMRFDDVLIENLQNSRWWMLEPKDLKKYSMLMNTPQKFLKEINQ